MTKDSESDVDSEAASIRSRHFHKLTAILCPTICALCLICIFAVSYLGTKMAYDRYDVLCHRMSPTYRFSKKLLP